jgi:undecaprenyl pyrophosphate synthase
VVGHANGVRSRARYLGGRHEIGVKYLTLYAFSTENWNRPQAEVDALMDLLVNTVMSELEEPQRERRAPAMPSATWRACRRAAGHLAAEAIASTARTTASPSPWR